MANEAIGINGFGRVGQMVLRAALGKDAPVVAINSAEVEVDQMASMLQRDSTHGGWRGTVKVDRGRLVVGGRSITVYQETTVGAIPWAKAGARYIVETTGQVTNEKEARAHLAPIVGGYKVLVTSPLPDLPILIMGANEQQYNPEWKLMSAGCATATCLAPLANLLHNKMGVAEVMVTALRGATEESRMVDGVAAGEDWRAGRGAGQNILPLALGTEDTLVRAVPGLEGRVGGLGLQVQSAAVCLLDITLRLEKEKTYEEVCAAVKKASDGSLGGVVGFTESPLVSSDFLGDRRSAVVDFPSGQQLGPGMVKLVVWYDSETSFAARIIDLVLYIQAMDANRAPSRESSIASDNYASRSQTIATLTVHLLNQTWSNN